MGQGYSLTTLSAASATIDVPELADLVYEKTLASARFMKSVRARNQQGFVFVKAVMKPYPGFDVSKYVKQILEERAALAMIPNALGYQRIVEVGSGGFLVRQFINNSVYDRLSTRPFLEGIEKKWLAFQLLCAVRDCHAQSIYHGDIKTENLLVTSWNWLYLTDFSSSFKPATIPEDDPADFSFYFDTSGRRTCYLAPERFSVVGEPDSHSEFTWAMDIFSVGCVIAELFLEGPVFSLSQLLKYRIGDYSPEHAHLNKIENADIREMILNMIELDPEKRYSAEQHLSFYRTKIFPEYFYGFLHQYMLDLTDPSSGQKAVTLDLGTQVESDEKINRVYSDFDKISYFLGYTKSRPLGQRRLSRPKSASPVSIRKHLKRAEGDTSLYDGTLLFLTIVVSSVRNTSKASARLKACDLLIAFAERLPDEAKFDRILPYLVGLLKDDSDIVRVAALKATTMILDMVKVVAPINAHVIPVYLFPELRSFMLSPSAQPPILLRATYASCLASLALSSARILDTAQAVQADGQLLPSTETNWGPEASFHGLFDVARAELVAHFEEATKALITDPDTSVRRALLGSVASLCVFLGSSRASDVILSHLNTYVNDKDWILKCSFYEALVGVAAYVGSASLERFILPIMIQSLTDPEHFVVEKVFRSLARMSSLGLLQRSTTWELIGIAVRFLVHPSFWIRESAAQFVASSSRYASLADKHCIIMPLVRPFLKSTTIEVSEESILDALKPPISKVIFESALNWARRSNNSAFWDAASRDSVFTLSDPEIPHSPFTLMKRVGSQITPSQRNKEDNQPLNTLRTLGMTAEDEMKLIALREYILRVARKGTVESNETLAGLLGGVVPLTQIDVTPQNVFFDTEAPVREIELKDQRPHPSKTSKESHTITDALLEASTPISDRVTRQNSQVGQRDENDGELSRRVTQALSIARGATEADGLQQPSASHRDLNNLKNGGLSEGTTTPLGEDFPSSDPDRFSFKRNSSLALKHRNSTINLMSRKSTARADAETSTNSENAFAKLDGPLQIRRTIEPSPLALAAEKTESTQAAQLRYKPNHSYTGNDPNVLHLLENHFIENFAIDEWDFGPQKPPIDRNASIRRATDSPPTTSEPQSLNSKTYHSEPWHPSGHLLTMFAEHTAAINRVVAAPDHAFFVTASNDGTCKIWDTTRLEKNITPRSRHTHKHPTGSKVKALCFVDNTHTFISAADDGSIHAVKVECKSVDEGESTKYGKPILVRDWQIPRAVNKRDPSMKVENEEERPEHAIWLYHYRTQSSQSILLAATTRHRILAVDLKTMNVTYILENPVHHGNLTTFCVDKKQHWLLTATTHGILDLWDLRFRLRLRSFGIHTSARIDRLLIHPSRGHGKWVFASADGEISVWDIEKSTCREVYRPSSFLQVTNEKAKPYEAWYPDEEPREKVLERFARDLTMDENLLTPSQQPEEAPTSAPSTPTPKQTTNPQGQSSSSIPPVSFTIPALHSVTDCISRSKTSTGNPEKAYFLLTAGLDRTLRFWDLTRPENSRIISGPQLLASGGNDSDQTMIDGKIRARYALEHPLNVHSGGLVGVVQEILPGQQQDANAAPDEPSPRKGKRKDNNRQQKAPGSSSPVPTTPRGATGTSTPDSGGGAGTNKSKPPRNQIIAASSRQLLRTHMEGITDAIVLRKPYGCVVSVDRGGCVFVFQ